MKSECVNLRVPAAHEVPRDRIELCQGIGSFHPDCNKVNQVGRAFPQTESFMGKYRYVEAKTFPCSDLSPDREGQEKFKTE